MLDAINAAGMDVIILDHHEPDRENIPKAVAVIDPKRSDCAYPFKNLAAVGLVEGRPHVIGPSINIYNEATLGFFERKGATRICLPPELPAASLAALARAATAILEAHVFGRIPHLSVNLERFERDDPTADAGLNPSEILRRKLIAFSRAVVVDRIGAVNEDGEGHVEFIAPICSKVSQTSHRFRLLYCQAP